jgi:catechol 2,3-dioxygenase-like lactoylglutathione lyase family enzyme
MLSNPAFHHLELPCNDLELAERFYTVILGAQVYLRRDAERRRDVPTDGTITEACEKGFRIDATYLRVGDFRIGFIDGNQNHGQREIDHLAFVMDEWELVGLARRLTEYGIEVVEHDSNRMLIRDPFGLMLELWPRAVLARMGVL